MLAVMCAARIAMWSKWFPSPDENGIIECLNPVYLDWYGESMANMVGNTGEGEWPEKVIDGFWFLDADAIAKAGKWCRHLEATPGGRTEFVESHKIAFRYETGWRVFGKGYLHNA